MHLLTFQFFANRYVSERGFFRKPPITMGTLNLLHLESLLKATQLLSDPNSILSLQILQILRQKPPLQIFIMQLSRILYPW